MYTRVGRVVTRGTECTKGVVDLIIGVGLKSNGAAGVGLQPNTVYEIMQIGNDFMLVSKGESFFTDRDWHQEYHVLMSNYGKKAFLTKEEMATLDENL